MQFTPFDAAIKPVPNQSSCWSFRVRNGRHSIVCTGKSHANDNRATEPSHNHRTKLPSKTQHCSIIDQHILCFWNWVHDELVSLCDRIYIATWTRTRLREATMWCSGVRFIKSNYPRSAFFKKTFPNARFPPIAQASSGPDTLGGGPLH